MNDKDAQTRQAHALIALAGWLIAAGITAVTLYQWTQSPWILEWNSYGSYWMIGAIVASLIGNGILSGVESGKPGSGWNTVVGTVYLLLAVGLVLALVMLAPSIGYAMTGQFHGWWWFIAAVIFFLMGYGIMPTKKDPRKLQH